MTRTSFRILAVVAALGAAPLAARAHDFTFRDAEFMPLDDGIAAARDFVASRLPPGLPLAEARARLHRADMRCAARSDRTTVCDFAEVVHVEGGLLGEEHWTVRLASDAADQLTAATFDYGVIGTGRPGL